jgi:nucleoid DNA-binding protein
MDKYLMQILKDVNTIIIPGLGALTITNEKTGEIMFMPYLKYDDGKLSDYIAKDEGIPEIEAKNIIAKYVRDIQSNLDQGDSYDMFKFGSFAKDKDGDVMFTNWTGGTSVSEEPKKTVAKKEVIKPVEKAKEVVVKPVVEPNVIEEPIKPVVIPEVKKEVRPVVPVEEKKEEKKIEEKHPDKAIFTKEAVQENKEEPVAPKKPETSKKESVAPKAAKKIQKEINKVAKEPKIKKAKSRGVGFWMLMGFIGLIVAGGVYFALNYDSAKQHIPFLEEKKESPKVEKSEFFEDLEKLEEKKEEVISEPELVEEPIVEEKILEPAKQVKPVKEIKTAPVEKSVTSSGKPYHIITGSFTEKSNANRMVKAFNAQGNTEAFVITQNGKYMVSAHSFNSKQEARQKAKELNGAGWVFKWNK